MLFIVSLFISGLGVALAKRGELGVPPISSVANVLSLKFDFLTLGNWLIVWNCVLILGQVLIRRRTFEPIQLLQIPLSFLFGYFTDFGMWIFSFFDTSLYPIRLMFVLLGTAVLGFGISLSVIADVIMNSGEAFVRDLADAVHKDFGNVKIIFDICCVISSAVLSLFFFDFQPVGIREGTIIAAVCTGLFVKLFIKPLRSPVEKMLND